MTKEDKMNKAKELAKVLLASDEKVEDTPKEELKVGDTYEAEDGDHEVEGMIYVVKDNVITDIKGKPEGTEDKANVELEEDVVIVPEVEDTPVDANTEPKMEDVLNMEGLAKLINLPNLQDGYISISASVVEGKLAWGEMYTEDYKILMSEQKASTDKQILELQEQLEKEKAMVVTLSESKPSESLINAPEPEVNMKDMTPAERLIESYK